MSFFTTSAHLSHRTLLPKHATREAALRVFANHDALLRLDPELVKYELVDSDLASNDEIGSDTLHYKVTDKMETLPAHIWDTTVTYTSSITNIEDGVIWVVKAPLGLVQDSRWTIEPAGAEDLAGESCEDRLVLVEEVDIRCSRLLMSTIKAKCEGSWRGVHARWITVMESLTG